MLNKINHFKIFIHALRTALVFVAGLLTYEFLKLLEDEWNKTHPDNEILHFTQRKSYHFIAIFLADLIILYFIALSFSLHL
jgi:hypothetical protein